MKRLPARIKYLLIHSPVRFNLLLIGALVWITYRYTRLGSEASSGNSSSYQPLLVLLVKTAAILLASLMILSLITTLIAYIRFRILSRKGKASFLLNIQKTDMDGALLRIRPALQYNLRPFLGFISGRLRMEQYGLSAPFILASVFRKVHSLRTSQLYGTNELYFRDIKEYQVTGSVLYFEDMFRLIRLSVVQDIQEQFYHPPSAQQVAAPDIVPQAQEEMEVRIEQMRKVEGEYLNYKQFEYGDDVRRIVWKIYGRSRELVVRNPEVRNPYASECYFYASFYNRFKTLFLEEQLADELLNYYKQSVWSLYTRLQESEGLVLHYVSEQKVKILETDRPEAEQVQRQIAQAAWQQDSPLLPYFDIHKGSICCIHSLTDIDSLTELLGQLSPDQYIHFVPLSACFNNGKQSWIRRIFMQHPQPEQDKRNIAWRLSPQRSAILKNEASIRKLLSQYGY